MSPFSMALMSGLSRQSVGASIVSMVGSSSFSVIAKLVKLYIYAAEQYSGKTELFKIICLTKQTQCLSCFDYKQIDNHSLITSVSLLHFHNNYFLMRKCNSRENCCH